MGKPQLFAPLLIALLWAATVAAQSPRTSTLDSIVKKVGYYARKSPAGLMFVHLDKTIYTNNEEIWFTSYILNVPPVELAGHQVLSVALVNDDDNSIAAAEKFINAGRLGFGHLIIPDTLSPGNYTFVAYTNRKINGRYAAFFAQPITLKLATQPAFNVVARVDTLAKDPAGLHVSINASAPDGVMPTALVTYTMGVNKQTRVSGKGKTNANGDFSIIIPRERIKPDQHILEIKVKQGAETKALKLFMPMARVAHNIRFYPEGGHLVAGLMNQIAWEAKNAGGAPLKATAVLYAGATAIDTIVTDSYGMGTFSLQPAPGTVYRVKLLSPQSIDTVYRLPAVVQTGVTLHIANALANDSLRFSMQALQPQMVYMVVQNYNDVFATMPVQMPAGRRSVRIDLTHIPRGLNTITLLDSLHRPVAERLFFAHHQQKAGISIITNNQEYGLRKKVDLTLKLKSKDGKPVQGIVSVACAQDNRFDIKKDNNIENYVFLRHAIDNLPLKDNLLGTAELDKQYLNELLLVRGWSKYKWMEMEKATAADTVQNQDSISFTARITRFEKPPKKPVTLLLMRDSMNKFETLNSNATGDVQFDNFALVTNFDKKLRLVVSGASIEYVVNFADPYKAENKAIAASLQPASFSEPPAEADTRALVLKGMERATNLREVKIVAKKENYFMGRGGMNANRCGDYVCSYHILNCHNHVADPNNRAPQPGEIVYMPGHGQKVYSGCSYDDLKAGMIAVKGIYQAKEFYGADYSFINPTEPDYLSTICWKHAVSVSSEAETKFSFYTSDITGTYRIVVQGITADDVVYGERTFMVKKQAP